MEGYDEEDVSIGCSLPTEPCAAGADGLGQGGDAPPRQVYPSLRRSDELPVPATGKGAASSKGGGYRCILSAPVGFGTPAVAKSLLQERSWAHYQIATYPDAKSCYRAHDLLQLWKCVRGFGKASADQVPLNYPEAGYLQDATLMERLRGLDGPLPTLKAFLREVVPPQGQRQQPTATSQAEQSGTPSLDTRPMRSKFIVPGSKSGSFVFRKLLTEDTIRRHRLLVSPIVLRACFGWEPTALQPRPGMDAVLPSGMVQPLDFGGDVYVETQGWRMEKSGFAELLRLLGAKPGDCLELSPAGRTAAGRLVADARILGPKGGSSEEEGSEEEGSAGDGAQGGEPGPGPSAQAAAAPHHHHRSGCEEEAVAEEEASDGSWLAYDSLRCTRGVQPRPSPKGAQVYQAGTFRVQVQVSAPGDPHWSEGRPEVRSVAVFRDQPSCWRAYDVANLWRGVHRMCGRSLDQLGTLRLNYPGAGYLQDAALMERLRRVEPTAAAIREFLCQELMAQETRLLAGAAAAAAGGGGGGPAGGAEAEASAGRSSWSPFQLPPAGVGASLPQEPPRSAKPRKGRPRPRSTLDGEGCLTWSLSRARIQGRMYLADAALRAHFGWGDADAEQGPPEIAVHGTGADGSWVPGVKSLYFTKLVTDGWPMRMSTTRDMLRALGARVGDTLKLKPLRERTAGGRLQAEISIKRGEGGGAAQGEPEPAGQEFLALTQLTKRGRDSGGDLPPEKEQRRQGGPGWPATAGRRGAAAKGEGRPPWTLAPVAGLQRASPPSPPQQQQDRGGPSAQPAGGTVTVPAQVALPLPEQAALVAGVDPNNVSDLVQGLTAVLRWAELPSEQDAVVYDAFVGLEDAPTRALVARMRRALWADARSLFLAGDRRGLRALAGSLAA